MRYKYIHKFGALIFLTEKNYVTSISSKIVFYGKKNADF